MKLLCTSTSHGFTFQVRLALDEAGIEYFCSDADSSLAGIGTGVGSKSRIYLLDEGDWSRTVELMQGMSDPIGDSNRTPAKQRRSVPRWLVFTIAMFTALFLGLAFSN